MTPFTIAARLKSFRYAFDGIAFMLRTQPNAWVHGGASVAVVGAALWLGVSAADWRWLVLAMALVWVAETVNTAIEHLCDVVSPERNVAVQRAKDLAAAAVLISAIAALLLGALVFVPYLLP